MNKKLWCFVPSFILIVLVLGSTAQENQKDFYLRGALYLDWFGAKYEGSDFFHQLSTRLRLEMINRRGDGWTFLLDTRDRMRLSEKRGNKGGAIKIDHRLALPGEKNKGVSQKGKSFCGPRDKLWADGIGGREMRRRQSKSDLGSSRGRLGT